MNYCVIGMGSNEQPEYHCRLMIEALRQTFGDIQVSDLCKTPALGVKAADYINAVVAFRAEITYPALRGWCRSLEAKLGRERGQVKCCADLDILYCADDEPSVGAVACVDEYYKQGVQQVLAC
ncbi:2-amino-4-hydroxy-6-hydroxymethyldihydropteridine diphosphokinase [Endozoicomonas sp.]|nr:2-amino-4-hydroxy-6-hydroxymethyldihydropteridine diphosphokinase [Endozoicomonas sp.]